MKTEIDPNFRITESLRAWADKNVPQLDIDRETERFIDYWLSHGTKRASWEATWRNWMRKAPEMGGVMKPKARAMPAEPSEEELQRDRERAVIELEERKKWMQK